MQIDQLNKAIMKKNINKKELAESIGMNESTFYRKQSGESTFTVDEAQKIQKKLELTNTEMISIFFEARLAETR